MTDDSRRQEQDTDDGQLGTERDATSPGAAGAPSRAAPVAVSLDKSAVGENRQSQQGGSSPWATTAPDALASARDPVQGDVAQRKLIAGLLGIFLGSLGVHKFYLGLTQPGVIMLACTLAGYVLFTLLAIILIGFVFLLVPGVVGLIGLIEGVLYLTKSDADFQREYLIGKKPWF